MPLAKPPVAVLVALTLVSVGCGSDRASRGKGSVNVVATTVTLADLSRNAGGRRVVVEALVPRTVDPHGWTPGAGARAALADAELVVRAGGELDAWLLPLLREHPRLPVVTLLPRVDPLERDSHWWHDPVRVQRAVKEIRNELARADVDGAGYYEAATADYLERLQRLDQETRTCLAVAGGRGPVVAQHDAFRYFSDRYGLQVVGPSASRGAHLGRRLWADGLGPPGSPAESYLGAFAENVGVLVTAVSGGAHDCRPRV